MRLRMRLRSGAPVALEFNSLPGLANASATERFRVRDLWNRTELGVFAKQLTLVVPDHGVRLVLVSRSAEEE